MVDVSQEPGSGPRLSDESVGELVQRASRQTAELMKQEMQLAQLELKQKGRRFGVGAGMFGAAGIIAFYGGAVLVAAAVLGLAEALAPWLSALVVGGALLVVAALAATVAKAKTSEALPAKPERAAESVQDDIEHIKEQAQR